MINVRAQIQTIVKTAELDKNQIGVIANHFTGDGKATASVLPGHISLDYIPEITWPEINEIRNEVIALGAPSSSVYERMLYGFSPSYDALDDRSVIVFSSDNKQIPKAEDRSIVIDPCTHLKFASDEEAYRNWVGADGIGETRNDIDYFFRRLGLKMGCVTILTLMKLDLDKRMVTFRIQFNLLRSGLVDNPFLHMDEMVIMHDYTIPENLKDLDKHYFGILEPIMNKLQIGNFRHTDTIMSGVEYGAADLICKVMNMSPAGTRVIDIHPDTVISNGQTAVPPLRIFNPGLITSVNSVGYPNRTGAALSTFYANIKSAGRKIYTAATVDNRSPKFKSHSENRTPAKKVVQCKVHPYNPTEKEQIRGTYEIPIGYNDLVRELTALKMFLEHEKIECKINPTEVRIDFPDRSKAFELIHKQPETTDSKPVNPPQHKGKNQPKKEQVNPEVANAQEEFAKSQTEESDHDVSDDSMFDELVPSGNVAGVIPADLPKAEVPVTSEGFTF